MELPTYNLYRAWNNSPENFVATREYLTALEAAKDWPAIMKVVQRLHDKKQSEIGYSYLVRWFDNDWYSRSIGLACRHLGAPQFMPDAIRDIVEVGCTRGDPRSQLRYLWGAAEFLHEYCDAYEDPIRYYEQALQMTLRNDASTIVKMAGGLGSSIKVAPLYFDLAVASRSSTWSQPCPLSPDLINTDYSSPPFRHLQRRRRRREAEKTSFRRCSVCSA